MDKNLESLKEIFNNIENMPEEQLKQLIEEADSKYKKIRDME